jgi:ABC-2 type transport system ATP-binding protein
MTTTAAIEAVGLGKHYDRKWALRDTTLSVPQGRVVGLVGANGAGKTTLLHMMVGLVAPSEGHISVFGDRPASGTAALAKVGFLAQDAPLYGSLTVRDHLRLGARMNPRWNTELAESRTKRLGLPHDTEASALSGGQRAQLALTVAVGKQPELLVLDEPVASLDPLARRQFLTDVMEFATDGTTVVLSSHLLDDVERVCDYLIVIAAGQVRLAGDVDDIIASHKCLTGERRSADRMPSSQTVISERHADRQSTYIVRTHEPILDPAWQVTNVTLEELVLAYMATPNTIAPDLAAPSLGLVR